MAVSAIAGIALAAGQAIATEFVLATFLLHFALGAGLSMVSRALMPKPSLGTQMSGTTMTVREPASTRKIVYGRARVGGSIVFMDSTGTKNEFMHMVIAIAGHAIDTFEQVYFNDQMIWEAGSFVDDWGDFVHLGLHDGTQTTADSTLVAASTLWTSDHKLLDTAYMYVRLKYDVERFGSGLPNLSAVVKGKKVYNPATSTTVWTQNPALIVRDYLLDTKYGLAEVSGNINSASVTTAQTLCDEQITLAAGGTQSRYICDGVINTGVSREDNIENLLSSMAGRLIHSGGEYFVSGAAYVTPTITIDESVMVGAISIKTKQSRRSLYNGVKGVFLSEEENYILADYPSIISSTYSAADGDPIYLDMPLPFTTNNIRAQRLAKLALLQSRQQTQITIPCNLAALQFKAGDMIMVTNAKIGWSSKVFNVLGYAFDLSSGGEIIVNVDAIETSAALYDWTSSDEQDYLSGGEIDLYDGRTVAPPTSFVGTASTTVNADGSIVPSIVSTWVASDDAFVTHYDYQWSPDNVNWNAQDVNGLRFTVSPVVSGDTYYTRVRAVNDLGVRSDFVTLTVVATADTTAPGIPTSITASGGFKQIMVSWVNPTDTDFKHVDVYASTTSGGTYTLVGVSSGGSFVHSINSFGTTRYYKVKASDFSDNISGFSAVATASTEFVDSDSFTQTVLDLFTAAGLYGVEPVSSLPATGDFQGQVVFLTTDNKLYRWNGSAWTAAVPSVDITGQLTNSQIADLAATKVTGQITTTQITDSAISSPKIAAGSVIAGKIAAGTVVATDIAASTITGSKIAAGTITASNITANTISGGLIAASGIITSSAQINDALITNAKIDNAAITTAKIGSLQVSTLKIADNAVTIPEGDSGSISVTLNTTFQQLGNSVRVAWTDANDKPEALIVICGFNTTGGSASQTVSAEVRRVYSNGAFNGIQQGNSYPSGQGGGITLGGYFDVVTAVAYVDIEIWAKTTTGTKPVTYYSIGAIGAKK